MNRTQDLFGMVWIESFDLLNQPFNSFCYSAIINSNSVEKLRKESMKKFLENFVLRVLEVAQKLKRN